MNTPALGAPLSVDGDFYRPPIALVVTGQEWVSLTMESLLAPRGFAVLRAFTGLQALQRVHDSPPDLIIIERDLRDTRGVDLAIALRQGSLMQPTTPVLLIAMGPIESQERTAAYRAGVWEVCSLPTNSEELILKLETWVRAKLAGDLVREQGLLDPDTGLYNAKGLLRRLAELGAGAGRYGRPLACVVLAPEVTVVEAQGDAAPSTETASAVRKVAAMLRGAGRASDTIGRLSPTEFVVVAPDTDRTGAEGLAERLKREFEADATSLKSSGWHVRFGTYAVEDFRNASVAPTELLIRAAEALRT